MNWFPIDATALWPNVSEVVDGSDTSVTIAVNNISVR